MVLTDEEIWRIFTESATTIKAGRRIEREVASRCIGAVKSTFTDADNSLVCMLAVRAIRAMIETEQKEME